MSEYDDDGESVQLLPTLVHGGGSGQAAVQEKGKEWGGWWGWMGMGGLLQILGLLPPGLHCLLHLPQKISNSRQQLGCCVFGTLSQVLTNFAQKCR